jgi:hypothetical protein
MLNIPNEYTVRLLGKTLIKAVVRRSTETKLRLLSKEHLHVHTRATAIYHSLTLRYANRLHLPYQVWLLLNLFPDARGAIRTHEGGSNSLKHRVSARVQQRWLEYFCVVMSVGVGGYSCWRVTPKLIGFLSYHCGTGGKTSMVSTKENLLVYLLIIMYLR